MFAWLWANAGTIVIFLLVASLVFLAVRSLWKDKKSGKGCSGSCAACGGCGGVHSRKK